MLGVCSLNLVVEIVIFDTNNKWVLKSSTKAKNILIYAEMVKELRYIIV